VNIWFATNNAHKKQELEGIFATAMTPYVINIPSEHGLSFDPDERGTTFLENALIKARALRKILHEQRRIDEAVIADDSGLCVDALGGRPGIYSARYGGGGDKKLTDAERNALLIGELSGVTQRSARFVCALVLLLSEERFCAVQETLEGEIISEERGAGGFGYDPLLFIPALGGTLAELPAADKNRLSHRGKAAASLLTLSGQLF
jgi:XTP/dITP diphosphohydrolase